MFIFDIRLSIIELSSYTSIFLVVTVNRGEGYSKVLRQHEKTQPSPNPRRDTLLRNKFIEKFNFGPSQVCFVFC